MIRQNSYDFVRFAAALAVLIAHQFFVSGGVIPRAFGEDLAGYGLDAFFSLSGFLIFQSLDRSRDWALFLSARITRLLPTLIVALIGVSLITLVVFSNYGHLIDHIKYIYRNFFLLFRIISDFIPGVFSGNPHQEVNTPLWSLAYELWLYAALFLISRLPRSMWPLAIVGCLVALSVLWLTFAVNEARVPFTPIYPMRIGRLGCFFFSGALIASAWPSIEHLGQRVGVAAAIAFVALSMVGEPTTALHSVLFALSIIGLGSSSLLFRFSRGGDPSYGMYVFAWPIQQLCQMTFTGFYASLLCAIISTVAVGYVTWHLYEKRAISYRRTLAELLRSAAISSVFRAKAPDFLPPSQPTPGC